MFLRMVTHAIRDDAAEHMKTAYGRHVMTALRTTPGFAFAALLQNTANLQECISLTIWESQALSSAYEASGLYRQLVDALRPMFSESNEWKLELSADLSLEYTPIVVEPTVEGFNGSGPGTEQIRPLRSMPFAIHMITLSVLEAKLDQFESLFRTDILPAFKSQKGFIELIRLRKQHEFHIVSFWDETVDIGPSGALSLGPLPDSVAGVIPSYARWQSSRRAGTHAFASSEDIRSSIHRCLLAEWFAP
jgi:heme-degrading monooxygenase HmoA